MAMIRRTRQRRAVLDVLEANDRPLTPGELHELARGHDPRIGLRTVYRHVRQLVAEGRLIGVDYPGQPRRYELVSPGGGQAHFICRICSRVFPLEIEVPVINPPNPPGFVIEGEEVIFYGRCNNPACRRASAPRRRPQSRSDSSKARSG